MNDLAQIDPQQRVALEQTLVSSLLLHGRGLYDDIVARGFTGAVFTDPDCAGLFEAVSSLAAENKPIELVSVAMRVSGNLAAAAGLLGEPAYGPVSVRDLAARLVEFHRRSQFARKLVTAAHQSDLEDALSLTQAAVIEATPVREGTLSDVLAHDVALLNGEVESEPTMTTGFASLDHHFTPVGAEFVVIAGRTSTGKSSLALNIALANLRRDTQALVAVFSIEDGIQGFMRRIYAHECGYSFHEARTVSERERGRYVAAMKATSRLVGGLRLYGERPRDIDGIQAMSQKLAETNRLRLVIVDYLQLVSPPSESKRDSREQQVAAISRRCQGLARLCRCPVLGLSQLNRECDREEREPRISDLRESGSLEQDADRVWLLWRPPTGADGIEQHADTSSPQILWTQAKARNGPRTSAWFQFTPASFKFTPIQKK